VATTSKYEAIADAVLTGVGGAENVESVTHCATRLRFRLKDRGLADKERVEQTPGVITVQESGGQFQVVIGNTVNRVYDALVEGNAVTTAGDGAVKGSPMARVIDVVTSIFTPFLWVLAGTGLLKALLALVVKMAPSFGGTTSYAILYTAADGLFQFLPFFLAVTAAKKFKANVWASLAIASALVYSDLIAVVAGPDGASVTLKAFADGGGEVTFLGIPVLLTAYVSSVIPILLAVYAQSKLENLVDRILPDAIRNFLAPILVIVVIVPLTFLIIGPAANWLGDGVSWLVNTLWDFSPAVGGALVAAGWQIFVIFGLHWALIPVIIQDVATQGYSVLAGALFPAVLAQGAAALAVFFKTRNRDLRTVAGPAAVSAILAGVTEPAIYGVTLRLKKPFIFGCIGAAVGGAIAAAGGSGTNTVVLASGLTLPATLDTGNFTLQLIGSGSAMVIAFVLTMVLGFKDIPSTPAAGTGAAATEPVAHAGSTVITAPVAGTVIPLSEVADAVFASGALGAGAGVLPSSGHVVAPVSGVVVSAMPHAYGLRSDDGVEVLVHVGIDTVKLDGRGFTPHVRQGEQVRAGDPLVDVDLTVIETAGYDTTTVVVITNSAAYADVEAVSGPLAAGDVLATATA
jgi:PTS system beta-glucosides-specific IIC component